MGAVKRDVFVGMQILLILLLVGVIVYGIFTRNVDEHFSDLVKVAGTQDVILDDVKLVDILSVSRDNREIFDRIERSFGYEPGGSQAVTLTEKTELQIEKHHTTGDSRIIGADYLWRFKNDSNTGITLYKYRTRIWNWYPGSSVMDKEKLKQKQDSSLRRLIVDEETDLDPPVWIAGNTVVELPFTEKSKLFRLINLRIPYGISILHEFFGRDDQGNEVHLEETTAKGFSKVL